MRRSYLPTSENKAVFHLVLDKTNYEKFKSQYPELLRIFLNRCVERAVNDPSFFENAFFHLGGK